MAAKQLSTEKAKAAYDEGYQFALTIREPVWDKLIDPIANYTASIDEMLSSIVWGMQDALERVDRIEQLVKTSATPATYKEINTEKAEKMWQHAAHQIAAIDNNPRHPVPHSMVYSMNRFIGSIGDLSVQIIEGTNALLAGVDRIEQSLKRSAPPR